MYDLSGWSISLLFILILSGCGSNSSEDALAGQQPADTVRLEFDNYQTAMSYFDSINYTPEAWAEGIREVPLAFLMDIPESWRKTTTREITIQMKKRIFFRVLAPLVLYSNTCILDDRNKLQQLMDDNLTADNAWVEALGKKYKVTKDGNLSESQLLELRSRVDIVPPSLALAQTAEESGWGTSRFAAEGNALFGQWGWGKDAMKPKFQREGKGDYGLAKFDTPLASMEAYMLNLNTHAAYKSFRSSRATIREQNGKPTGAALANTLTKYSERGQDYVRSLQAMMRINKLEQMDSAYLKMNPVILLIPLAEDTANGI